MTYVPTFNPSPYGVTWEHLKRAQTCARKLCLIYRGEVSDSRRKKRSYSKPTIPLGQPSASALGIEGERSVAQSIAGDVIDVTHRGHKYYPPYPDLVGGQVTIQTGEISIPEDIVERRREFFEPGFTSTSGVEVPTAEHGEFSRFEKTDESVLDRTPSTALGGALKNRWTMMRDSIVAVLDEKHSAFTKDVYHGLEFSSHEGVEQLRPDLTGIDFDIVFPQVTIGSRAILLRGIIDFIGRTSNNDLIPLEVKTSARASKNDVFQLTAYLNTLSTSGLITEKFPLDSHFTLASNRYYHLYNLMRKLVYETVKEIKARLQRMILRRNLDNSELHKFWITGLTGEVLRQSKVWKSTSNEYSKVVSEYKDLWYSHQQTFNQTFTKGALSKISQGLLIYPRLEETVEVDSRDIDFRPILQSWIDSVLLVNKGEILAIPENAPCGRCGYKLACGENAEHEFPEYPSIPVPILFEEVDKRIRSSDVVSKNELRKLLRKVTNGKLSEFLRESIMTDGIIDYQRVRDSWAQVTDNKDRYGRRISVYSSELGPIQQEIFVKKTSTALKSSDKLGKQLDQWDAAKILKESRLFSRRVRTELYSKTSTSYWGL